MDIARNELYQQSEEWFQARLGKVTASRISDVMSKGRGITRSRYMSRLIDELRGAEPEYGFESEAMIWGIETEPEARRAYEKYKAVPVKETGFIDHPHIENSGASPDGLIGAAGLIEIKCPNTATHLKSVTEDYVSKKYIYQMQWQLACTGRKWCDFVSYDPRTSPQQRIFVKRFPADSALIAILETEVSKFIDEMKWHLLEG